MPGNNTPVFAVTQTALVQMVDGQEPTRGRDQMSINFTHNELPHVIDSACVAACNAHNRCDYVVRMGAACYLKKGDTATMRDNPSVKTLIPM